MLKQKQEQSPCICKEKTSRIAILVGGKIEFKVK